MQLLSDKKFFCKLILTNLVSNIVKNIEGSVFVTQPAKSVESSFSKYLPNANTLIDSNDPYSVINNYAEHRTEGEEQDDEIITVITNGSTIFRNLPFLSSTAF